MGVDNEAPAARPVVHIDLSRSEYRLGCTVVGTVRFVVPQTTRHPRDWLESLQICIVGRCRLDQRWHNVESYQQLYGVHPSLEDLLLPVEPNTVCFWATQPIDLLDLHERIEGCWPDGALPIPIHVPKQEVPQLPVLYKEIKALDQTQLAYTFRCDLPRHLPPSLSAASCRYYYTIVIRALLKDDDENAKTTPLWVQLPLQVLSALPDDDYDDDESGAIGGGLVQVGTLSALAHSRGLPTFLNTAQIHRIGSSLTVHGQGAAFYRHTTHARQSMRVADESGRHVCILTITGLSHSHPGSRVLLVVDFPRPQRERDNPVAPCYQVSACLEGYETALHRDGTTRRARSFVLATAHEYVDPLCTERVALNLLLPLDANCTIATNVIEIVVTCRIDLTVTDAATDDYRNLRLDLPCNVGYAFSAHEIRNEDELDQERNLQDLDDILYGHEQPCKDPDDPRSFETRDIHNELVNLSLSMASKCGLLPGF